MDPTPPWERPAWAGGRCSLRPTGRAAGCEGPGLTEQRVCPPRQPRPCAPQPRGPQWSCSPGCSSGTRTSSCMCERRSELCPPPPASPTTLRTSVSPACACPRFSDHSAPGEDAGNSHLPRKGRGCPCRGAVSRHWSPSERDGPAGVTPASRLFLCPAGPDGAQVRQPEAERRKRSPHQSHQQTVQVGPAGADGGLVSVPVCARRPSRDLPLLSAAAAPSAAPQHPRRLRQFPSRHHGDPQRLGIRRRLGVARPASDPASRRPPARPCGAWPGR